VTRRGRDGSDDGLVGVLLVKCCDSCEDWAEGEEVDVVGEEDRRGDTEDDEEDNDVNEEFDNNNGCGGEEENGNEPLGRIGG